MGRGGGGVFKHKHPMYWSSHLLYMFKESTHDVDREGTKNNVVQMKYRIDQKLVALEMCSLVLVLYVSVCVILNHVFMLKAIE